MKKDGQYYNVHGYQLNNKHDAERLEKQLNLLNSTKNIVQSTENTYDKIYTRIIRLQYTINTIQKEIDQIIEEVKP